MTETVINEIDVKSVLTKSNLPVCEYSVNPYVGCTHACKYCYANESEEKVRLSCQNYDPHSPLLCGVITQEDKITERKVKSLREEQISIFDF